MGMAGYTMGPEAIAQELSGFDLGLDKTFSLQGPATGMNLISAPQPSLKGPELL